MKSKEFTVEDFVAEEKSFIIEINDRNGAPLKSVQLKIAIDDEDEKTIDAEDDGRFNITPSPGNKLTISGVIGGEPENGEKNFPIAIEDRDGNPLQSVHLTVTIDDGDEQTVEAGDDGQFMIQPIPKSQLKITGVSG